MSKTIVQYIKKGLNGSIIVRRKETGRRHENNIVINKEDIKEEIIGLDSNNEPLYVYYNLRELDLDMLALITKDNPLIKEYKLKGMKARMLGIEVREYEAEDVREEIVGKEMLVYGIEKPLQLYYRPDNRVKLKRLIVDGVGITGNRELSNIEVESLDFRPSTLYTYSLIGLFKNSTIDNGIEMRGDYSRLDEMYRVWQFCETKYIRFNNQELPNLVKIENLMDEAEVVEDISLSNLRLSSERISIYRLIGGVQANKLDLSNLVIDGESKIEGFITLSEIRGDMDLRNITIKSISELDNFIACSVAENVYLSNLKLTNTGEVYTLIKDLEVINNLEMRGVDIEGRVLLSEVKVHGVLDLSNSTLRGAGGILLDKVKANIVDLRNIRGLEKYKLNLKANIVYIDGDNDKWIINAKEIIRGA